MDVFQYDNRVVDEDADAQGHAHEGHHVKGEAGQVHGKKSRNQGCRNGNHDGQRRLPAPEEEEQDQPCRAQAFDEGLQGIVQGIADIRSRFIGNGKGIVRIVLAQFVQLFGHIVDRVDDVGVAVLVNGHDDSIVAVDTGITRDSLVLALDGGDRRNGNLGTLGIGDLDLGQFAFIGVLGFDADVRRRA